MEQQIRAVCKAFRIEGDFQTYSEIGNGNINHTYKATFLREGGIEKSYILQQVNTHVFRHPVEVMSNIDAVTEHIRQKMPQKINLHFHHTEDRKTYVIYKDSFWRLFNYIPSRTFDSTENLRVISNMGQAFGDFQIALDDFDPGRLFETIPDFHHTRKRYEHLAEVMAADKNGRAEEVQEEYAWLLSVKDQACMLTDLRESGELPLRVTHNDTKINNVLFSEQTDEAIVVIDLDTVMPGLVGNDFGDAVRFCANDVTEDSPAYDRAGVNLTVFEALADGFLSRTAGLLTQKELATLAASCFCMTAEEAVRFMDDYVDGDHYFKIKYPRHNLDRTRNQVALAKDMLLHLDEMQKIIVRTAKKYIGK